MILNTAPMVGAGQGFTVTTTGVQYANANPNRSWLAIQNNGAVAVYIGFGVSPTATTGYTLAAGATFNPPFPPGDAIWLASASSTAAVVILEG